jgi:hypothetical protein
MEMLTVFEDSSGNFVNIDIRADDRGIIATTVSIS